MDHTFPVERNMIPISKVLVQPGVKIFNVACVLATNVNKHRQKHRGREADYYQQRLNMYEGSICYNFRETESRGDANFALSFGCTCVVRLALSWLPFTMRKNLEDNTLNKGSK